MQRTPRITSESRTSLPASAFCWLLVAWGMLAVAGCGGCGSEDDAAADADAAAEEADPEKKKEKDFLFGRPTPLLSRSIVEAETTEPIPLVKPGHWTAVVQQMQANYDDFSGRTTLAPVDAEQGDPIPLQQTTFTLLSQRPVVLAKRQPKWITNELYIPDGLERILVDSRIERGESASVVHQIPKPRPWTPMLPHQYFFLVLARDPGRYAFLKVTDSVRGPWEDEAENFAYYYRVAMADAEDQLPLSPNVLTWTSVAYILWDEVNLDRLEQDQQQALVDWLHWGGRLIINGPDSLGSLRGTFLDPYLPADPGETVSIDLERLKPLAEYWGSRTRGEPLKPPTASPPWSAVALELRPEAQYLAHTAELFAEKRVGRGSVVVSAVQLAESQLINWEGYDGLLNNALLNRPHRRYMPGPFEATRATWADMPERRLDPRLATPLRWLARDHGVAVKDSTDEDFRNAATDEMDRYGMDGDENGTKRSPSGPSGAWDEFGPVPDAAREALRLAAGVRVPGASFVVACLTLYLVVLVPLNWMVFHALGRVEWAWIAAPVIAVVGAVVIVYQANLDIGFVRAQTEIAVLEMHGDYPRGHLTRYDALYASLATSYGIEFEDQTALAKPFPAFPRDSSWKPSNARPQPVLFQKYDKTRLTGISITSASSQMIHSESMIELEGAFRLTRAVSGAEQVVNQTGLDLKDAVVVRRRFRGQDATPVLEGTWVGKLRSGQSQPVPLMPLVPGEEGLPFSQERQQAARLDFQPRIDVDELLRLAFEFDTVGGDRRSRQTETRLIARVDNILPGAQVEPRPSQQNGATIVVAHLEYGQAPPPRPDDNSPSDVKQNLSNGT